MSEQDFTDYIDRIGGHLGDRTTLYQAVAAHTGARRVLYPGSYLDLSPPTTGPTSPTSTPTPAPAKPSRAPTPPPSPPGTSTTPNHPASRSYPATTPAPSRNSPRPSGIW